MGAGARAEGTGGNCWRRPPLRERNAPSVERCSVTYLHWSTTWSGSTRRYVTSNCVHTQTTNEHRQLEPLRWSRAIFQFINICILMLESFR